MTILDGALIAAVIAVVLVVAFCILAAGEDPSE